MTINTINVTIESISNTYKSTLQAQNPKINAFAPNTVWAYLAMSTAATVLDLYYNNQLILNSVYPQNAVGDQVDLWLYKQGLPARIGQSYATVSVIVTSTTPIVIPINTIFTDSATGNQYQTLENITVPDNTTQITLYALVAGSNQLEIAGSTLTSGTINVTVQSSLNGQEEESDQSCINRILTSLRAPISGSRQTDYQVYCLDYNTTVSSPIVTDSIVIPSFLLVNNVGILGVFPVGGTSITDYQLNKGLLPATSFTEFSRALSPTEITGVDNYIQSLRLVGLNVHVGTSITYQVATNASPLAVNVSLVSGYNLLTKVNIESQDINNQPIIITLTIGELIKREIRRAICGQAFGATQINFANYITLDSIIYAVNLQLNYQNGNLAQVLTNFKITGSDISVPYYTYSVINLYYTYDIESYNSISITLI